MSETIVHPITPAAVVAWFAESFRPKGAKAPSIDSSSVAAIVRLINELAPDINAARTPDEIRDLEKFKGDFIKTTGLCDQLYVSLGNLERSSIRQFGEDDGFVNSVRTLHALLASEWIDYPAHLDKGTPWHDWAWSLYQYIVSAWAEVDEDGSSINRANPTMRVLRTALAAIDGDWREEATIEGALRRRKQKETERAEKLVKSIARSMRSTTGIS